MIGNIRNFVTRHNTFKALEISDKDLREAIRDLRAIHEGDLKPLIEFFSGEGSGADQEQKLDEAKGHFESMRDKLKDVKLDVRIVVRLAEILKKIVPAEVEGEDEKVSEDDRKIISEGELLKTLLDRLSEKIGPILLNIPLQRVELIGSAMGGQKKGFAGLVFQLKHFEVGLGHVLDIVEGLFRLEREMRNELIQHVRDNPRLVFG